MGVANFFVKVARPAGTKDFKLAVFEHIDDRYHPSAEQLETTFQPQGWKPFVKVVSRKRASACISMRANPTAITNCSSQHWNEIKPPWCKYAWMPTSSQNG